MSKNKMILFSKHNLRLVIILILLQIPNTVQAGPTTVFVSIAPQKYFVERIGGDEVQVEVMVNPGESPATFNPNPKKMSQLANAKLYFSIGVPFEKVWISRIKNIQPKLKVVPLNKKIYIAPSSHPQHDEGDPHIWLSPPLVKIMAAEIEASLSRQRPEKSDFFKINYQTLIKEIDKLDQEIQQVFAKGKNRTFMVFHPAWTHFAEAYGLEQISIENQGKEPGPRALQRIINKGKKLNIKVIFVQKQFGLSVAKKIAKMIGATVKEMDPLTENYMDSMRNTAKAISGAIN
ncbi:MAG: zinc ABC transporter solute-binding protein [Nitrospina sp.]|nr:zinc ABC transporter solute-binding protein [Nitrospina sp.]